MILVLLERARKTRLIGLLSKNRGGRKDEKKGEGADRKPIKYYPQAILNGVSV